MAALPTDLPPESRANLYVMLLDWDGGTRKRESHQAAPTAAIIDSQSAKAAQERGSTLHSHGFDAGQKITGPTRHVLIDTLGLLLRAAVLSDEMQ
jgi:hypothetical protein